MYANKIINQNRTKTLEFFYWLCCQVRQ